MRVDVEIKNIELSDLHEMIDSQYGSCKWYRDVVYPDSHCEVRIIEREPEQESGE